MKNTALHALGSVVRIAVLFLMLGSLALANSVCADCAVPPQASRMPCPSLDWQTVARSDSDCAPAAMSVAPPCAVQMGKAAAKESLPASGTPGVSAPVARLAALVLPPSDVDARVRTDRSPYRNASLAVLHCSFQL